MDDLDLGTRLRTASRLVDPDPALDLAGLERRRDRAHRRQQFLAASVAVVLSVAVVGGVLAGLHFASRTGPSPAAAGGPSSAPQPALLPGQYLYINRTIVTENGRIITETWWASDDSGRIAFQCTPDCAGSYGPPPTGSFGPGSFPTDDNVTGLSADPAVLLRQMEQRTAPGGRSPEPEFSPGPELTAGVTAGSLWDAVTNVLADPTGGPDLRSALFDVLTTIPGVQVDNGVADPAGRIAVALELSSIADGGGPSTLYFDQTTHQLMAEGGPPGTNGSSGFTVYDEGVVTSTDAPPSGDQWLFPPA